MLEAHPDKNPNQEATEQSKILNDAKDRALKICLTRDFSGSKRFENDEDEALEKMKKQWAEEDRKRKEDERKREREEEEERKNKEADEKRRKEEERRKELDEQNELICKTMREYLRSGFNTDSIKGYEIMGIYQMQVSAIETSLHWEQLSLVYAERVSLYYMAAALNDKTTEAEKAKTSADGLETKLLMERTIKDEAVRKLADLEKTLKEERKEKENTKKLWEAERLAKDQRLAEMTKRLDNEDSAKDQKLREMGREHAANLQKLVEITQKLDCECHAKESAEHQLAGVIARMEGECSAKDDAKRRLAELGKLLDDEKRAKDTANQQLAEMVRKTEDECRAKDYAKQQLAEMTVQMERERLTKNDAEKQLSEMTAQIEAERAAKDNAENQVAESKAKMIEMAQKLLDASPQEPEDSESICDQHEPMHPSKEHVSTQKKRKTCDGAHDEQAKQRAHNHTQKARTSDSLLKIKVSEFVEQHLDLDSGNFITSKQIMEAFVEKHQSDGTQILERNFQVTLKECIFSKYPDSRDVSATRARMEGERPRGYSGLTLNKNH